MKRNATALQAVQHLHWLWHSKVQWAEALICAEFGFSDPRDILGLPSPRVGPLGNSGFHFRCHGSGVDIYRGDGHGGIDFDFETEPCVFRLWNLMKKQVYAGNLPKWLYRPLLQDDATFRNLAEQVLAAGERLEKLP